MRKLVDLSESDGNQLVQQLYQLLADAFFKVLESDKIIETNGGVGRATLRSR